MQLNSVIFDPKFPNFFNNYDKSSRSLGPQCTFWAPKRPTVHWPEVCNVQLTDTWRQAGLIRGFVGYSEN